MSIWARPDLAHALSVLGRYVHNLSEKVWIAYHRIAKYLIKTKDIRIVFGSRTTSMEKGSYTRPAIQSMEDRLQINVGVRFLPRRSRNQLEGKT